MPNFIEAHEYTEFTYQTSTGSVIVQIPHESDMPIQIIVKIGKEIILKLDEFEEIREAVEHAMHRAGWQ